MESSGIPRDQLVNLLRILLGTTSSSSALSLSRDQNHNYETNSCVHYSLYKHIKHVCGGRPSTFQAHSEGVQHEQLKADVQSIRQTMG